MRNITLGLITTLFVLPACIADMSDGSTSDMATDASPERFKEPGTHTKGQACCIDHDSEMESNGFEDFCGTITEHDSCCTEPDENGDRNCAPCDWPERVECTTDNLVTTPAPTWTAPYLPPPPGGGLD